jgi:hypothetical protein
LVVGDEQNTNRNTESLCVIIVSRNGAEITKKEGDLSRSFRKNLENLGFWKKL